ncbi:syncollin-like [Megalops cyprinoides]|uniref:syncollin-like n=1 Tax=Megalops cyprinoides TaxID=118141 RepID=UPI0018651D04|nr:syncollin-like [Megalops cyprinoides]
MTAITVLLLLAVCIAGLQAQCPDPGSLTDASGNKVCARMFEDSHYYYEQSCGGDYLDAYANDDFPFMPRGWNDHISSLVVSKFCSLTVWSRSRKEGSRRKFTSGIQYRLKDVGQGLFGDWDNDISAYYCEC